MNRSGPGKTAADLNRIREYIDRYYARPLTIARLARLAGLSPYHFIRAFRAATGATPHQYLRDRRIGRAKDLLVTTPIPVTEVCDAVGFRSLGSFSTVFRKLTGETPAAYRAHMKHGTSTSTSSASRSAPITRWREDSAG